MIRYRKRHSKTKKHDKETSPIKERITRIEDKIKDLTKERSTIENDKLKEMVEK